MIFEHPQATVTLTTKKSSYEPATMTVIDVRPAHAPVVSHPATKKTPAYRAAPLLPA